MNPLRTSWIHHCQFQMDTESDNAFGKSCGWRTSMNRSCGICPQAAAVLRVTTPCNGRIWRNRMAGYELLREDLGWSENGWWINVFFQCSSSFYHHFPPCSLWLFKGGIYGIPCTAAFEHAIVSQWFHSGFTMASQWFSAFSLFWDCFFECCGDRGCSWHDMTCQQSCSNFRSKHGNLSHWRVPLESSRA